MARKSAPKKDDPAQSKRFIEAAKEAEADERPDALDRAFDKVVTRTKSPHKPANPR